MMSARLRRSGLTDSPPRNGPKSSPSCVTRLKRDPSILRDAVVALQSDDGEREKTATRAAGLRRRATCWSTPNDPVAGNPDGNVTIVEFFDVRCLYCRKLEPANGAAFLASDPDVRLVYKDLPGYSVRRASLRHQSIARRAKAGRLRENARRRDAHAIRHHPGGPGNRGEEAWPRLGPADA